MSCNILRWIWLCPSNKFSTNNINKTCIAYDSENEQKLAFQCKYTTTVLALLYLHLLTGNVVNFLYLKIFLLSCMDVHPDPGPSVTDDSTVLSVFHINIRSLRNKISYLSDIASEYDIICVSETHLNENVNTSDLIIDGYYPNPIRKDRNAHGGGLLIYVSERLLVKRQEHLEYNTESIWIKVIFPRLSFLICCVYRPPNCNDPFWDNFHHSVETAAVQSNCLPASTQRWNNVETTLIWTYDVAVRCFNVETTLHFWRWIYNVISTLFQRHVEICSLRIKIQWP